MQQPVSDGGHGGDVLRVSALTHQMCTHNAAINSAPRFQTECRKGKKDNKNAHRLEC